MGDFPPEWTLVRHLSEGGQAHTFVVRRSDGTDSIEYVLKRLRIRSGRITSSARSLRAVP
jgi:hypothetical protein